MRSRLLIVLLAATWAGAQAPVATLTVSPAGPYPTLEAARDAIRALKAAGRLAPGGLTVVVRAGTYELRTPLRLTAEDAGTAAAPIVYRAAPGERVILTGARHVTGFVPWRGAIVKADLAAQGLGGLAFQQVFHNGQRQHLARYPNFDPANPHGGGFAYVAGAPLPMYRDLPTEELRVIRCRPGDSRAWAHPELGKLIIFPRYNWINMELPIVGAGDGTITLGKDVQWGGFKGIRPLDRYYVRGLLEELDAPGEWYLDRATSTLYFWPPAPGGEVRVPVVENLIELGPKADYVTLRGFILEGSETSAVQVRDCSHVRIVGNTIHDVGGRLGGSAGVSVSGGRDCGVVGNDVYECCNYGIRLDGSAADTAGLLPSGHFADNNYVHHIGVLNGHGCGIIIGGVGQRVSHNLIHDTTRCGVFGGGPDCVIEYNHIRHVNLETEDTGGTYMGGAWHIRGMVYRYNFIHDVLGYGRTGDRWTSPHFAWGIYLDDDLSGVHVHGNIVARTTLGGTDVHAGRDNLIENNILIGGRNQQAMWQAHNRQDPIVAGHWREFQTAMARPAWQARYPELVGADLETLWKMAGNRFLRNILSYDSPGAKLYAYWPADAASVNQTDYNLIWHAGQKLDFDWAAWQAKGLDTHSVIADPLFVDAAHDDYRLRPESPAFALGFKPIPVEQIGPYASDQRATWPIVEAPGVRETPLVETRVQLPAAK